MNAFVRNFLRLVGLLALVHLLIPAIVDQLVDEVVLMKLRTLKVRSALVIEARCILSSQAKCVPFFLPIVLSQLRVALAGQFGSARVCETEQVAPACEFQE